MSGSTDTIPLRLPEITELDSVIQSHEEPIGKQAEIRLRPGEVWRNVFFSFDTGAKGTSGLTTIEQVRQLRLQEYVEYHTAHPELNIKWLKLMRRIGVLPSKPRRSRSSKRLKIYCGLHPAAKKIICATDLTGTVYSVGTLSFDYRLLSNPVECNTTIHVVQGMVHADFIIGRQLLAGGLTMVTTSDHGDPIRQTIE